VVILLLFFEEWFGFFFPSEIFPDLTKGGEDFLLFNHRAGGLLPFFIVLMFPQGFPGFLWPFRLYERGFQAAP